MEITIQSSHHNTSYKWLVLTLAIFFVFAHIKLSQYAFDDAYIHLRVARNLLETGTPYFNPNEAIKVGSSSGWILFLAVVLFPIRLIGIEDNFPLFLSLVNAMISLFGMLIYTKIVERVLNHPLSGLRKFLFQASYLSMMAVSSIGLMETPLAVLLFGAGIYNLLKSHSSGFVWLGLAVYFRIELFIVAGMLGIFFAYRENFPPLKNIFLIGLGMLPFLLYDLYFFQTVIPNSIIAKSVVYSINGFYAFTRLVLFFFPRGLSYNELLSFSIGLVVILGVLISIVGTAILTWKTDTGIWILIFGAWALLIILGYLERRVLLFEWYAPLYTIPMFLAITLCANVKEKSTNNFPLILQSALAAIYLLGLSQAFYASTINPGVYEQFEIGSRVRNYIHAGRILNNAYPNSTLLSSEIGGLGYTFQGYITDAAGLASPDALDFHPMKIPEERARGDLGSIPPEYVEKIMPEFIVSYDHFASALLSSKVMERYSTILIPAYFEQDIQYARTKTIWGNEFLRIYIRKDLPVPDELIKLQIK